MRSTTSYGFDMAELPINPNGKKQGLPYSIIVCIILAAVLLFSVIFNCMYLRVYIVGSSMNDTFTGAVAQNVRGGDFIYVHRFIKPERGDVVVVQTEDKIIIKRVIGIEGDTVELVRGQLYLNGNLTEEPYVLPENSDPDDEVNTFAPVRVPDDCVFCMGDNRNNSYDSRGEYGCISVDSIIGIAAEWSLVFKDAVTSFNTFFEFTLPEWFK